LGNIQRISEVILARSRVDRSHRRLYCLGPSVGRISFASQQYRALNLIWALHQEGIIQRNSLVAIVGAGVSGVTAAVALRAFRCSVKLFDSAPRPLHRQRGTTHRQIHPTINWWPMDPALSPTTSLPFLNWTLGQCDAVIKTLEQSWKRAVRESGEDLRFIPEDVFEALPDPANGDRLQLRTSGPQHHKLFDVVIVASGFGDELAHKTYPALSYWRGDNLEDVRDNKTIRRVIVSGFGDGGLIDSLRLAYDFDYGRLSFRAAELAFANGIMVRRIVEIESKLAGRDLTAALGYEGLARDICTLPEFKELHDFLEEARNETPGYVVLIDSKRSNPYESGAAAIHKLLIAYAAHRSTLRYLKGELPKPAKNGTISIGGKSYKKAETHVVIRHGAKPYQGELVTADEWDQLLPLQEASIEYNYKPAWNVADGFPVPDGWPCRVKDPQQYISEVAGLGQSALHELGSRGKVIPKPDHFIVVDHNVAFRPTDLFGVQISYREIEDIKLAEPLS
jgi:hypothetical protein